MQKNTYKIYTLGCKVNQYDSGSVGKVLRKEGFFQVENKADFAIVNTCAVTKTAISKAKSMLNKARKENPFAKIILMGCWPKTHEAEVKKFDVDLIWHVGDVEGLMRRILKLFKIRKVNKTQILKNKNTKARYFLKVQDGCEQFCSYCVIPYARGPIKSRLSKDVVKEAMAVCENGTKEIVLSGIHLGLYGSDFKNKINLVYLVEKLLKIKDIGRLRLSSIEINEVSDELLGLLKNEKKLCRHLHIPLQAGSEKILKLMNRPYTKKEMFNRLMEIKKLIPFIALTTDVIVGFPGETEEEFLETCELVKSIKFSKVHVFPYSRHEKTPSAKFSGQISSNERKRRARILRLISKRLEEEYIDSFRNKKHEVIIEQVKDDMVVMKSEFYFDVCVELKNVKNLYDGIKKNISGQILDWHGI